MQSASKKSKLCLCVYSLLIVRNFWEADKDVYTLILANSKCVSEKCLKVVLLVYHIIICIVLEVTNNLHDNNKTLGKFCST